MPSKVINYDTASAFFKRVYHDEGASARPAIDVFQESTEDLTESPAEKAELLALLAEALRELEEEQADAGIMTSPRHAIASVLQTVLSEHLAEPGIEEAFKFDKEDVGKVLEEVRARTMSRKRHEILRPANSTPEILLDVARLFVCSDFGTGRYGATVTARTIEEDPGHFDVLLHLGDVYYSGEIEECRTNFLEIWPRRPKPPDGRPVISRGLNGNHEMYSKGYGYFDVVLPAFQQASSYFAMQNGFWTLVCMDTAHTDNDLDPDQVKWIRKIIDAAGDRKVILFSHHPLFSNFKKEQGVQLAKHLAEYLEAKRITAWYWGHEHHCVLYDRHPAYNLITRCLGHGGMPYKRKDLKDLPVEREVGGFQWRRMSGELTPDCLFIDGPNQYLPEKQEKYGPHGYMTLEFDDADLTEKIHAPTGEVLYEGAVT
jgi:hypothetical protein